MAVTTALIAASATKTAAAAAAGAKAAAARGFVLDSSSISTSNKNTANLTSGTADESSYQLGGVSFSSSPDDDDDDDNDENENERSIVVTPGLSSTHNESEAAESIKKRLVAANNKVLRSNGDGGLVEGGARDGSIGGRGGGGKLNVNELENEIAEKESLIKELRDGYDDLSLRARIVSILSYLSKI